MQSCWSTLLRKHHCNKQSLLRGLQPSKSQCRTYGLLVLASPPKLAPVEETPKPAQPSKLSFHLKVAKIQNFNCYQRTGFLASFFNDKCIWKKGCTKAETMTARDYWLHQCGGGNTQAPRRAARRRGWRRAAARACRTGAGRSLVGRASCRGPRRS